MHKCWDFRTAYMDFPLEISILLIRKSEKIQVVQ